jgi:ATP-dependent helicase/nuclease subunit A
MAAARKRMNHDSRRDTPGGSSTRGATAGLPSSADRSSQLDLFASLGKPAAATNALLDATWTDQQRQAIETRDVSIALSAGAGCGKTFVLTERFLSHLEPTSDADLADLVAFTYTERAAREMRDRIRRKCRERLDAASDANAPYWLALLRQLDTARVSTIHSFCGSFLRSHAVEAGLDPHFAVLDEAQSQTRLWELVDDALRRRLEARDADLMDLAGAYGLGPVRDRILTLLRHRDHAQFDAFAGSTADALVAAWQSLSADRTRTMLAAFIASPACAAAKLFVDTCEVEHEKITPRVVALRQLLASLPDAKRPSEVLAEIKDAAKLTGLSGKMFATAGIDYEAYKECVQTLRAAIDDLKHLELDLESSRLAARYGLALLAVARDVAKEYRQSKREDHALDFNDLLLATRGLLCDPEHAQLRRGIARQVRLLLVDESQDTDPVQTELIDALCDGRPHEGKLFVVGDFKQSIYRFLGAEPGIFRDRRQSMPERGRLPLSKNFRSQPAILDFVNLLFSDAFGVDYEPLIAHRPQATPPPAIEFLWANEAAAQVADEQSAAITPAASKGPMRGDAYQLRRIEADWIARRISAMIRAGIPLLPAQSDDSAKLRIAKPGDIAILFRTLSNVAMYEEALRRYDLPYYVVGGRAFYAQQEIFDIANLLRALVSPSDEISLAGALRSPLFNLSDEALFWLAQHQGGLRAGLFAERYPTGMEDEQQRRAARAKVVIAELRSAKDRMPVAALLNRAITLTGYDAALLSEFLGERKLANLQKLVNLARSFDRTGMMSLADFVVQLNEFEADQPKEALAATESEAGDVVRLMTIHQSKGLEFPIVIVADCETRLMPDRDSARFDPAWGPLVGLPSRDDDDGPTTALRMYKAAARIEEEQEAIRLFYVATTRAADFLVISGGTKDHAKPQGFWTKFLAERFDRTTGEFLGELPDGATPPRINVITMPPDAYADPTASARGPNLARIADAVERAAQNGSKLRSTEPSPSDPIVADITARRFYSFSSLSGKLVRELPTDDTFDEASDGLSQRAAEVAALEDVEDDSPDRAAALDLGTLVHAIAADLRWDGTDDPAALARRHMERQLRTDEVLQRHAAQLVERLLTMPIAKELATARERRAEIEFLLAWPPGESERRESSPILHGFIDMLFQDANNDWHIVDFKTNRVKAAEVPTVARQYELQLMLYAIAAGQSLGQPVKSLRLCFLEPQSEHQVTWIPAAKKQAFEMISTALLAAKCE